MGGKWALDGLVKVFDDNDTKELVVANHFLDGPAGLPPLVAVQPCRATVAKSVGRACIGEPLPKFPEERRKVVEKHVMMNALGRGLFINRSASPLIDDDASVPADYGSDQVVGLSAKLSGLHGHEDCSLSDPTSELTYRRHGCRLILLLHARKNIAGLPVDDRIRITGGSIESEGSGSWSWRIRIGLMSLVGGE
jgi:hypothetical protein